MEGHNIGQNTMSILSSIYAMPELTFLKDSSKGNHPSDRTMHANHSGYLQRGKLIYWKHVFGVFIKQLNKSSVSCLIAT